MDWWLANFFLGSILSLFLPIVPDIFVLFSLLLLSIIFFFYSYGSNDRKPLRLSSGLLFGMSWMLFNAFEFQHKWQGNNLEAIELASKAHWLEGQVLSLQSPQKQNDNGDHKKVAQVTKYDRLRFNFNVTHINNYDLNNHKLKQQALAKEIKLRLSWKNPPFFLQQGQRVLLKVKFKPTHGLANQGGFSYQTWLNNNSISGTGYVINHKNNRLLNSKLSFRQQLFNDYKQLLSQYLFSYPPKNTHQQPYQNLPEKPPKQEMSSSTEHELVPLLLALGFGSKAELNTELWQVLQATGTGHLVAISGLHIGLVATGSYFLFMLLIRILPLQYLPKSDHLQVINSRYFAIGFSLA
nr:ComEC/Rec2 family competence protein [Colwellia sp.]